ncbi:DNA-binding response regulator [Flexivirga caeni]|uniref:DNA-binding response regulator n=1 Tax=Flexivirga caeni TaxID=2294115 RepID=A0A3M9M7L8_9MICO|nr:DNA-binding response regulator [Flexivirga caeni]
MRVVVAEDAVLFREGLIRLLGELGHRVVAAVDSAHLLPGAVESTAPDLAVVDIRMPPGMDSDGARAAVRLRSRQAGLGILLLSQHVQLRDCRPLIGTPGFGYLLKDRVLRLDDFDEAVRRVGAGGTALDPQIVRALVESTPDGAPVLGLTDRERQVLELVAQGHSNTRIAALLRVSDRTVESHMRAVFGKLGLYDDGTTHRRVLAVLAHLESRDRA